VYTIFANVIELDEAGALTNAKYAEFRAAQRIRSWCDPSYKVVPPLEGWETELCDPPERQDVRPWPRVFANSKVAFEWSATRSGRKF
jgi:hypothetical protein